MEWKKLNKREARKIAERWDKLTEKRLRQAMADLDTNAGGLNPAYRQLRNELLDAWDETQFDVKMEINDKARKQYLTDLLFGIRLFRIMEKMGMNVRLASLDDIWIYIGMGVVPEITLQRFEKKDGAGAGELHIPVDHYYKKSVRIYLKSLWWFIYLSMRTSGNGQPDLEATKKMLWDRNTDTILQLVERSGRDGYRVDLYRKIMEYYCEHRELTSDDFRKVLILNTAKSNVMEPAFSEGGTDGYVKELFHYLR